MFTDAFLLLKIKMIYVQFMYNLNQLKMFIISYNYLQDIEPKYQQIILIKFNKFKMNDFMTWLFAITINEVVTEDNSFNVNSKPTLNDFDAMLVERYFEKIGDAKKSRKLTQEEVETVVDNEQTDKELKRVYLDDVNGEQHKFGF